MKIAEIGDEITFVHRNGAACIGVVTAINVNSVVCDLSGMLHFHKLKLEPLQVINHKKYKIQQSSIKTTKGITSVSKKQILNGLTPEKCRELLDEGITSEQIRQDYNIAKSTFSAWKKENNLVGYKPLIKEVTAAPAPITNEIPANDQLEKIKALEEQLAQAKATIGQLEHQHNLHVQELKEEIELNKGIIDRLEADEKARVLAPVDTENHVSKKIHELVIAEKEDLRLLLADAEQEKERLRAGLIKALDEKEAAESQIETLTAKVQTYRDWELQLLRRYTAAIEEPAV